MFSKQKSKFKTPYTHYFMDKEAQVVLGKKQLAPHAIYHRQNRAPYSSVQVNYDNNQRTISVLTNVLFSIQHVLSPHLRVLFHVGDTVRNGRIEGQIWNTAVLNAIHSSDSSDADSVLLTSGPRYPTASTVSLSLHNIALSHMKQLPTVNPTWISGHALCRFVNEQLKLSQLEVSVRVQPEQVKGLNNGVAVFKFFTKYFDKSRPNAKKGVFSASYVHRINSNWFVGGGVKANIGDSHHRGYRLRTGERDINWGGVVSVPRLKLGVLYQHDPLDATVRLRARLRNADNIELTGQVEKNISEYGLSPYVHAKYSSVSGEVKVGLGVNFSGI